VSEVLLKILAVCLIAAAVAVTLKPKAPEYAMFVSIAAAVIISGILIGAISSAINEFDSLLQKYGLETEYFKIAVKALGIGYITGFVADSCRDCGQASLASKAEFGGKCAIFILSMPLIHSLVETAVGFIK
jgi:stage III sporulation protein AD